MGTVFKAAARRAVAAVAVALLAALPGPAGPAAADPAGPPVTGAAGSAVARAETVAAESDPPQVVAADAVATAAGATEDEVPEDGVVEDEVAEDEAATPVGTGCRAGRVVALTPVSADLWAISDIDLTTGVVEIVQQVTNPGGSYRSAETGDGVNRLDALALSVDGTVAYLTDSDARLAGQVPRIHRIDLESGAMSTFPAPALVASTPAEHPGISAGAVDTATGIFYYAHAVADSDNWLLYGWDTTDDTPLGLLGTVNGRGLRTGDLAVDSVGDLVLTTSWFGETRFHRVAAAVVPRAGSTRALPFTLSTTSAAPVISGSAWAGPAGAFTEPSIFLGVQSAGSGQLYRWTGGTVPSPTPIHVVDGSTDLASCDQGDVITLRAEVVSRLAPTDQFTVSVAGARGRASVTTSGVALGIQPQRATLIAAAGSYSLEHGVAPGATADYAVELTCTERSTGAAVDTTGTGTTRTVDHPGGAMDCLWRNRAVPTLTVTVALSLGRFVASDQFTVALRAGSPTGPVVSAPADATTVGTTSLVTAGTGTTGQVRTSAGTTYHLTQTAANAATLLSNYAPTLACTDPSGLQPALPRDVPFDQDFWIEVVDGAQVTCVLDNVRTVLPGPLPACGPGEVYSFTTALGAAGQGDPGNRRAGRVLVSNPPAGTLGTTTPAVPTQLPLPPVGGYDTVNAAAVSPGGRALYYVAGQPADSNSAPAVMRYDVADPGATWTPQVFANPSKRNITRGGLNPTNGLLYLSVTLGTDPTQHDFWAFDTFTDTMIGYVGRWTGPSGINGDLVFDLAGNMIFVAAGDFNGSLIRVENMPTTPVPYGTDITASLRTKTLVLGASGLGAANGAAFDTDGYLYLSTASIAAGLGTSWIRRVDPNDGTLLGSVAVVESENSPVVVADLADCNDPGALRLLSDLTGRVTATDQFNLVISPPPGSIDLGNRTSTTGSTPGLQPAVAGPVVGVPGRVYTLTQVSSPGSLTNYEIAARCRDLNHDADVPVHPTGTAGVYTLTFPAPAADGMPAAVDCTLTTTPTTRLSLRMDLETVRAVSTDQFSVHARAALPGGTDLPIVSPATGRVSAGTGNAVTAGTGTTGLMPVVAGAPYQYWMSGAGTPTADTDRYRTTVTCTDARSRQTGLPTKEVFTVPLEITPILGAHLVCTFSNRVDTSVRLTKELGHDRVDPSDQFAVQIHSQAGTSVGVGAAASTGVGAIVTPGSGSVTWSPATAAQTATLRETKTAGATPLSGYDTTVHCTNDWTASPTVLPSGPGQVFTVVPTVGDRIACTLLNTASPVLTTSLGLLTLNGVPLGGGRMIKAGDVLGYRVSVTNTGKAAGATVIAATVPQHTSYSGDPGWAGCAVTPTASAAGTICTRVVTVAPGVPQFVDFQVTADDDLAGVLAVSAVVSASAGSCATCSTTMATAAVLSAAMSLSTVNGEPAAADQQIRPEDELVYTITVTNHGGSAGTVALTGTIPEATVFGGAVGAWDGCVLLPWPTEPGESCSRSLSVPAAVDRTPTSAVTTFELTAIAMPPMGTMSVATVVAAFSEGVDICTAACAVQNPIAPAWTLGTLVSVERDGGLVALESWDVARQGETLHYEVTAFVTLGTVTGIEITDDLSAILDDATLNGPATVSIDGGPPQPVEQLGGAPPDVAFRASAGTLSAMHGAVLRYSVTVGAQSWAATLHNDVSGIASVPPDACSGMGHGAASCTSSLVTPALVLLHNLGSGVNGPVDLDGAAFVVLSDDEGVPGDPLGEAVIAPFRPDSSSLGGSVAESAENADAVGPEALLRDPVVVAPTGAAGRFMIAGIDPGRYWLRQTLTPSGHTLLARDVPFTVEVEEDEPRTVVTVLDLDPNSPVTVPASSPDTIQVVDSAPFALPYTGGRGSGWLIWCGIWCWAASLILLHHWRRRSSRAFW